MSSPIQVIHLEEQPWNTAPDGAVAREIASPTNSRAARLSIADIVIAPGVVVTPHYHRVIEEIYYVVAGEGIMMLNGETQTVRVGDAIVILPGEKHSIRNATDKELRLIVTCNPPWTPDCSIMD
jgi:mannose-6-phosphate isomerase-like protein (cupin superfamily)